MKKYIILLLASILSTLSVLAQEETPAKFKLYGFIRNYTTIDSREVSGGTHDLYFYMPKGKNLNTLGEDLNSGWNWKAVSLTTRLGLDISAYKWGNMSVGGKVEADFYSLNGTAGSSTIAQLRMRLAYIALSWQFEDSKLLVNVGQTWHPMAADLPHATNLESGAPFGPFNRSPQIMAHYSFGKGFTATGGLLYLSQYLPMDAQANAKSVAPYKYGLPELYMGMAWKNDKILAKAGFSLINTKPIRTGTVVKDGEVVTVKVGGMLTAVTPFVFFQYTEGLLQLRAKSTLASSGEHMNLLSGYGISSYDADEGKLSYSPMRVSASFVSAQYGKKWQVFAMAGYMRQLGTPDAITGNPILNTASDTSVCEAFRLTPTVALNLGKFTISLEYDCTTARFAASRDNHGAGVGGTWITNHRIENMVKFTF